MVDGYGQWTYNAEDVRPGGGDVHGDHHRARDGPDHHRDGCRVRSLTGATHEHPGDPCGNDAAGVTGGARVRGALAARRCCSRRLGSGTSRLLRRFAPRFRRGCRGPSSVIAASGVDRAGPGRCTRRSRAVRHRPLVGWVAAAFFVADVPGEREPVPHWYGGVRPRDGYRTRFVRLLFQPVLVAAALWCDGCVGGVARRGGCGARRRPQD
jgi:hypothetical protein